MMYQKDKDMSGVRHDTTVERISPWCLVSPEEFCSITCAANQETVRMLSALGKYTMDMNRLVELKWQSLGFLDWKK